MVHTRASSTLASDSSHGLVRHISSRPHGLLSLADLATRLALATSSCAMDVRFRFFQRIRAVLANGPDLGFLSRDGGIRTHDLSVPKSPGMDWGGLVWTETPGQRIAATRADRCRRLHTRDGRAMGRQIKLSISRRCVPCELRPTWRSMHGWPMRPPYRHDTSAIQICRWTSRSVSRSKD
jgi:hypothetical protein